MMDKGDYKSMMDSVKHLAPGEGVPGVGRLSKKKRAKNKTAKKSRKVNRRK